ncbi:tail length tape measure protein [Tatumella sp. OPLPL6]|uniref:tail length tape measure protein n=1 Tax=Tatumella sp. OPLPL6 TaxID=1928657 RepID=UPI000C17FDFF|nr:tail length tape measure protein [Tatumella sp. OPLPL6]PIJ43302.1 tail length tape measure protein [Tatumella sp. OPLPL6]
MDTLHQLFLQSVTINGTEVPRSAIFKVIYIEKTSLQAPIIILSIHDTAGKIADDYKAKYGAKMVAEIGDPSGQESSYKENFFITSAPVEGDVVTVIATTEDIYRLKTPSTRSWLYTDRQPGDVMNAHKGSTRVVSDVVKKPCTYHLNIGDKPSKMLSKMAKDRASLVWIAQGVFTFRSYDALMKDPIAFEYEAYNPSARYTISRMSNINKDNSALEAVRFYFTSWSSIDGYVTAGDPKLPIRHISDADKETLTAMTRTMVPKLEIDVTGNAAIKAGMVIGITIHRMDKENQVSEALPQKMVVLRVAHVEQRDTYMTRMILGVPN